MFNKLTHTYTHTHTQSNKAARGISYIYIAELEKLYMQKATYKCFIRKVIDNL